ncbi:MAG: twin-arginine translocase TatA/TatE family subunit [Bacteroidetes bacterium QS_8_68_28]|jgi:sec-independent protein translocase protein TatA|nr:MAG: twin-arginine translocase TatA/TatE family subunit [Bacteroidetes bacterium QS_8_68_28]
MGTFGIFEISLIFLVVLLVFGAKRIPEIARGIGKGIREFKDATSDIQRELESESPRHQQGPRAQSPQQGNPQPRQQQPPPPRDDAGDAQREPAHQEAGRPASTQDGPPSPGSAANPGEEKSEQQ